MCNAYGLRAPVHKIAETFAQLRIPLRFEGGATPNLEPRELIAADGGRRWWSSGEGEGAVLRPLKWGFAPSAVKRPPVINFRSEGRRFGVGRALVLASWFFEFTGERYPKARHRFDQGRAGRRGGGRGRGGGPLRHRGAGARRRAPRRTARPGPRASRC